MECINIAGVSCRVDQLSTFDYETLFGMALNTPKYYQKANARKDIDQELRYHGFKPVSKNRNETETDNTVEGGAATKKRDSSKSSTLR